MLLEIPFIFSTFVEGSSIKVGTNITIMGRIEFLIIDTIENTEETITPRAQEMIEFLAEGRRQDFLGIAFAHSSHHIGKKDASAHNIDDMSQFSDLWIDETVGSNTSHLKQPVTKDTRIGKIMDSRNRL